MNFIKKNYTTLLFCFCLSFVLLSITSKCSFLYPFNDWVDANAFFTVGKGIFKGVVPFRDVFEQKGLVLYFIYGLASLISYKSFIGVFIFEVISMSIVFYYLKKIINVFIDDKYSYFILPIIGTLLVICKAFVHGGSCEEFCLPIFSISLYYYIYHFKVSKLSYKQLLLNGFFAGLIAMSKYTLLGFMFGFMAFIFFDFIFNEKNGKRAFLSCLFFLLGMFIPIGLCCLYLVLNGALMDYINDYIIINVGSYATESISIFKRILRLLICVGGAIKANGPLSIALFGLLPFSIAYLKGSKYFKITLFINICLSLIGIYWGLLTYNYYFLPVIIFVIISLIAVFKYADKYLNFKVLKVLIVCIYIVCGFCAYRFANYRLMLLTKKDDMFQFKYAEYINKFDNPTLLNMGYLDAGLYTTTGILPTTKFFEVQNIDYDRFPDNLDSMQDSVKNKKTMFVLYYGHKNIENIMNDEPYLIDNYHLVFNDIVNSEYEDRYVYLFQVDE